MAENKEYVIITGASSGIGLEFAKIFAEKGYNLILISLNINDLQEVHNSILKSHQCDIQIYAYDLIEKENIKSIFVSLKSKGIMAKTLINNAGFANYGEFISVDIGKQMDLIDLNIQALTLMSKLFIEQSENFQNARILNVSSMAGLLPGPFISVYAASKAYVFSFSMALASELKSRNIQVSVLCPADVKTNFQRNAGIVTEKLKLSDAALMVRKVYNDFMNGKRVIIPEKRLRFLKFILMFIPESVLSDSIYKKRKKLQ